MRRTSRDRAFAIRDLPLDDAGPLHDQIYRALRSAILSGRVGAGTRLPTTRGLAAELGVARNTVLAAFDALRAEGYVTARVGAGTFVAPRVATRALAPRGASRSSTTGSGRGDALARTARPRLSRFGRALVRTAPRRLYDAADRDASDASAAGGATIPFDFRPCVPDLDRLDYTPWRRALARAAWSVPASTFDYGDPAGLPELRREIASHLARARGVVCRAEEIVIVGGLAQALDLATRLLVDAGDAVLLEDPHYPGARRAFEAAGARLVAAPVDREGLALERVPRRRLDRCRLAYVTPSHQFPTGAVLSLARRQALLAWAGRSDAFVLEDDYDSEFRYAGRAIPALKSLDDADRVLYVGTFSKTLLPSLRLAYVVLPAALCEVFRSAKWLADWSSPAFEQAVLARHLASGEFERHLRRARTCYAASRSALVDAMRRELAPFAPEWQESRAGLHLLVRLPAIRTSRPLARAAAARRRGLGLYPVAPCHLAHPPATFDLVMGFARLGPAVIEAGVRRLAEWLADTPGED